MKMFFAWLFSQYNSTQQIHLFDIYHFIYLFTILGGTLALALIFRGKSSETKEKVLRIMAYLTIGLYVADFFIMPLSDSYNGISTDKLPFHVCTIMAVMVPFVQFNRRLKPIKMPVVTLSIASSLMWMCYPGSALGGQPPFCYQIFQTFVYHGFLFCWGALNMAYGEVKPDIRKIWKEFVGILMILVWASFGNTVYDGHNWFFVSESIFPFLADQSMPYMVVISVFGVCLCIYGIYFGLRALSQKTATTSKTTLCKPSIAASK